MLGGDQQEMKDQFMGSAQPSNSSAYAGLSPMETARKRYEETYRSSPPYSSLETPSSLSAPALPSKPLNVCPRRLFDQT